MSAKTETTAEFQSVSYQNIWELMMRMRRGAGISDDDYHPYLQVGKDHLIRLNEEERKASLEALLEYSTSPAYPQGTTLRVLGVPGSGYGGFRKQGIDTDDLYKTGEAMIVACIAEQADWIASAKRRQEHGIPLEDERPHVVLVSNNKRDDNSQVGSDNVFSSPIAQDNHAEIIQQAEAWLATNNDGRDYAVKFVAEAGHDYPITSTVSDVQSALEELRDILNDEDKMANLVLDFDVLEQ